MSGDVPASTATVARAAFPDGIRDGAQPRLAVGRVPPQHEAEIGGEIPTVLEQACIREAGRTA